MLAFRDEIAALCFKHYATLGKTGKPIDNKEWTLLSAIIAEISGSLEVVSLATGTKCIGVNSMRPDGTILNDSHAEVLARRGFLRYLYYEVEKVRAGGDSHVLEPSGKKYQVKEGVKWHLYSSHVPCGDASIIPMEECVEPTAKRQRLDIHRTGAKPVSGDDPKQPGLAYHTRGKVRVKPGRGDPTASLSCSDKISRWIYAGVQGALLSHLIEGRIKLSSIVIGGGGPFNKQIILDSLISRAKAMDDLPTIDQSSLVFPLSSEKIIGGKPAPSSVIWVNVPDRPLEVAVEGKRQGSTNKNPLKGMLKISKRELLIKFLELCPDFKTLTYREIKEQALPYQNCCAEFKNNMGGWSQKPPGLEDFSL